ncbi:hypothetical protein RvY_12742 [Ramazzottius varieornatus]|uniref:Uncharacterized protein n=1 Tax=Ramazzottius varieornatus TaxID=947166 RepID=A0A1D1VMI8_RAMVA|nr:hypothetical protein RvY_12742 [Ramazzottius varieornatus]
MITLTAGPRILRPGVRVATFPPKISYDPRKTSGNAKSLTSVPSQSRKFNMDSTASSERTVTRRVIVSPKSPAAIGPYSSAILANDTLYISGQLGIDASKGADLVSGGVEKEAEQALVNMGYILNAAGADYRHVVKTTVLLADINDFQAVNQVYAKFLTHNPPARAAYQVAALPKNARVEIEAIAVVGTIKND